MDILFKSSELKAIDELIEFMDGFSNETMKSIKVYVQAYKNGYKDALKIENSTYEV